MRQPALDLRTRGTLLKPQALARSAGKATRALDLRDGS